HPSAARRRHGGGVGGGDDAVRGVECGHPGVDDPHDHRCHRRRRRVTPAERGPVGRRRPRRVGVGAHHPGRVRHRRRLLPRRASARPMTGPQMDDGGPPRDRRVQFFLVAAVAALALYYPTPEAYRWVPLWLGIVYIVLALLS